VIIDFHCHAGRGDVMTAPWNTIAPLESYLSRARKAGIDRTVVLPAFHTDYLTANRELARIVARWHPRLIGFAMVNAKTDAGRVREMVREAVMRHGFRGLKVHGHDAMPTREVCEVAREFNVPIIVDVVGKAHVIDMFAAQYPEVIFVIAHLGSFADDWRAHERVIEQMVRYPNVMADTSGVRRFDYLVQAVKRAGPRRLVFGSDGPWLHPEAELYKIRLLGLPRETESLVLGGNARRVLAVAASDGRRRVAV
jgi:predicted TIM-barrel fold metal-dependent hydrolase